MWLFEHINKQSDRLMYNKNFAKITL